MNTIDWTLLQIALRTLTIYAVVVIGVRLVGKRDTGQMAPLDLVLLLLLANAVQNAMTGPDTSVAGGIVAATTLLVSNVAVNRLIGKRRGLRRVLQGTPRLLARSGHIIHENLEREHLSVDELEQALREHGVAAISDVAFAVLEVDGSISVIRHDEMPQSPRPHHAIRLPRGDNC